MCIWKFEASEIVNEQGLEELSAGGTIVCLCYHQTFTSLMTPSQFWEETSFDWQYDASEILNEQGLEELSAENTTVCLCYH